MFVLHVIQSNHIIHEYYGSFSGTAGTESPSSGVILRPGSLKSPKWQKEICNFLLSHFKFGGTGSMK